MSFFKKNETEKQEQPTADDKITIEDLAYMVYQIAEKVGVDFSDENEEGKENKSEEGDEEEHKEGEVSSLINDFLLSKGLTADEIRDVEEYYKHGKEYDVEVVENRDNVVEEVKEETGKGQPKSTDEKELKKKVEVKEEKQNSADSSKTSKIREAQRNEIQKSASPSYGGVSTERERVKIANAKYSL
jgi:hypothetical protein